MMASPASLRHQAVEMFLGTTLNLFVRRMGTGRVYDSQVVMRLGKNVFMPDVMYISNKRLVNCHPAYMKGPADLVIEVVSPESEERDGKRKFAAYEAGGVREYWLVAPATQKISAFCLGPKRKYRKILADKNGAVHSVIVPGFFVRPAWLWTDALDEFAALKELGVRI
jgi:Uma2 family endonuclease